MNKKKKLVSIISVAITALMLAGSLAFTITNALGLTPAWTDAYLAAGFAAIVCGAASISTLGLIITIAALAIGVGMGAAAGLPILKSAFDFIKALPGLVQAGDAAAFMGYGSVICVILAFLLGLLCYAIIKGNAGTLFLVVLSVLTVIFANAMSETARLTQGIPALIGAFAALAHMNEVNRDAGYMRAMIPAALAVALALMLVPNEGTTWEPLENAANSVRNAFDDYFRFTEERIAFSISQEGYDHAQLLDGEPTAMLGGPANPSSEPVLSVKTAADVLLRGSIRRTYTGYSWIDTSEKARYLYYDPTRRAIRDDVFDTNALRGLNAGAAFTQTEIDVRFLKEGTSTLFAPHMLTAFTLPLETATYYNSIGEMFMPREAKPGDAYSLTAYVPTDYEALSDVAARAAMREDAGYTLALAECLQIPAGVEGEVFSLTLRLTEGLDSYQKATAILKYLQGNMRYKTDVSYPPTGRDFVSYFLLESKEGYCSYFASAMALMCRIAGVPSRYVEGYSVEADFFGETQVTGEDAHAWVEAYMPGLGWVAFDPTTGGAGNDGVGGGDLSHAPDEEHEDEALPDPPGTSPDPTPEPTPPPEAPENDEDPFSASTPTPEPDGAIVDDPTLPPEAPDAPNEPKDDRSGPWAWLIPLILGILLLIALCVIWVRSRLENTDPVKLLKRKRSALNAGMMLYRAMLTLLMLMGYAPVNGETPEEFANRLTVSGLANGEFAEFSRAVTLSRYANRAFTPEDIEKGALAYVQLKAKLSRAERLRFAIVRIRKGLGDTQVIP